jgi:hypothetical protein
MTEITSTVALGLAALGLTMIASGRISVEKARSASYGAFAILGLHAVGVNISAPISSQVADTLNIFAFVWLLTATVASCLRGVVVPLFRDAGT